MKSHSFCAWLNFDLVPSFENDKRCDVNTYLEGTTKAGPFIKSRWYLVGQN